jgi:lysophospholipase L1-like esterase
MALWDHSGDRLKMMCVGDSITVGMFSTNLGGYRSELITSMTGYMGLPPVDCGWEWNGTLGSYRICGASGERTDECYNRVRLEAPAYAPECVFLHIGTNDTTQLANGGGPNTVNQSMGYLTQILDAFRSANSECIVFVSKIIDNQTWPSQVITYNTSLQTTVSARSDYIAGKVVIVDMYTAMGLYSAVRWGDVTHPNSVGYTVMASTFYSAFTAKF